MPITLKFVKFVGNGRLNKSEQFKAVAFTLLPHRFCGVKEFVSSSKCISLEKSNIILKKEKKLIFLLQKKKKVIICNRINKQTNQFKLPVTGTAFQKVTILILLHGIKNWRSKPLERQKETVWDDNKLPPLKYISDKLYRYLKLKKLFQFPKTELFPYN